MRMVKFMVPVLFMAIWCAVQARVVTVWGNTVGQDARGWINDFYNSLPGQRSSVAPDSLLSDVDLSTTDLLWITQPADNYTDAELRTMAAFVAAGGRIAFLGEYSPTAAKENARIDSALAFLGCTISINDSICDPGMQSVSVADGQILSHPLTAGVNTFEYAAFAPMTVSGTARALMVGKALYRGSPGIMMAYQEIGAGSVFVNTDQNPWTNASTFWPGGYDNARLFENLLTDGVVENGPTTNPVYVSVLSTYFTISWTYHDIEGDAQQSYEVEIWSGPGGMGTRLWNPPAGTGSVSSVTYDGSPLTPGVKYYARVRAADAASWGPFSEVPFILNKEFEKSHSLQPVVTENGHICLSLDAVGVINSSDGVVHVDKPVNATVRGAYLISASVPTAVFNDGDVSIEGTSVVWQENIPSSINSRNGFADVTSIVKQKIDLSPAGLVDITVGERDPGRIDGEILAVIFDDPDQTVRNTVVLFFGAQKVTGDDFYIRYAEPVNRSKANLQIDFSLGVSYGRQFKSGQQYSIIDVNGKRLTTSAGGEDDGFPSAGGLITVGGIGDSNDNPPDPTAFADTCLYDDELYSLVPFVAQGDTQTHIHSSNPSNDDNICFAALFTTVTTIVGEGILLTPVADTNSIGSADTLTATVQNDLGKPVSGRMVYFQIVNGPHAGVKDSGITDGSGKTVFIYKGLSAGQDEIVATMKDTSGASKSSNLAFHFWIRTNASLVPVADAGPDRTFFSGASCDTAVTLDGSGSADPDGGAIVSYSWLLPSGEVVTGATVDVVLPVGVHRIILTVVDDEGDSDKDTLTVTVVNRKPVFAPLSDTTIDEGMSLQFQVTAGDSDGTIPHLTAAGLPPGASFIDLGNGTGMFSMTAGCNCHGTYVVAVTARDCSDSVSGSFTLTIRDAGAVLGFLPTDDTTVPVRQKVSLAVGTIFCGSDIPKIQSTAKPSGSVFVDNSDGTALFDWTPDDNDTGTHVVVFAATDSHTTVNDTVLIHVVGDTTSQWPGEIAGGGYKDDNGDGRVDAVYLRFVKGVPVDGMSVSLSWPGAKVSAIGPLAGAALTSETDPTVVRVAIPDSTRNENGIRTGGSMSATVRFAAFADEQRTVAVVDSAAPVIVKAVYRIGDQDAGDTLSVWFSELVHFGTSSVPFTLIRDTSTNYSPHMERYSLGDSSAVFILRGDDDLPKPQAGDSLFINPVSAVRDSLCWQNNPANRRVKLNWEPGVVVKVVPIVSSGNDPMDVSRVRDQFAIMENRGKIIGIEAKLQLDTLTKAGAPVVDKSDGKPAFGRVKIYDAVGNLMQGDLFIKKAGVGQVYYVIWDGTNRNHRRVSSGAYLVSISYAVNKKQGRSSGKFVLKWR